tara:strand:- start:695 stop:1168 length:474 start_codon:yes stop_codon:yes gene_type:complete
MESSSNIVFWQINGFLTLSWFIFVLYRNDYVKKIKKNDFEKAKFLENFLRKTEISLMTIVPISASVILFFENPIFISYIINSSAVKNKLLIVILAILTEAASLKFCTKVSYEIENEIGDIQKAKKQCFRCDLILLIFLFFLIFFPTSFLSEILATFG